jgi:hypothetical protein
MEFWLQINGLAKSQVLFMVFDFRNLILILAAKWDGCERPVAWRWLTLSLLICVAFALPGCEWPATPPAPSPTPNPHPKTTYQLKISVQDGSGVNNVEVKSIWAVGNIGCLPIHPVSGATIQKQVEVNEKVEKVGSDYVATIIKDRFLFDKCKWYSDGWGLRFMHNNYLLARGVSGPNEFDAAGKLELTCIPPPDTPPLCGLRSNESFDRIHFKGVFNATLEIMK